MPFNVLVLIVAVFLLLLFLYLLQHFKKEWEEKLQSFLKWITAYAIIFGVLYFIIIEWPKIEQDQNMQKEQRRLYFLELLSNPDTPNRVREEAFIKLIDDYKITDFSGLPITNIQESYKTPFNFVRCFRKYESCIVNQDTIVKTIYNTKKKKYDKFIDLDKLLFWNTNLSYADFSAVTQKRFDYQQDWLIVDDEFKEYDYIFSFKYLTDTDLSYADLHGVVFQKGHLQNVTLHKASLYNANLEKTGFTNCDLTGTDLTGANLDSVAFFQTKIDEKTNFAAVKNYSSIITATPYIIERIKATHFFDKEISKWVFDWQAYGESPDSEFAQKWRLWIDLKQKYPKSYLKAYKESIKKYYTSKYDSDYDWEREL